ncbi:Hsp70 family protein [Catellatospora coxensis]|uniref:TIR domain-containing protein n=1 Tax=Catellatospora coxensis TaxID=310354 RepID=A0A8J3P6L0_9ACTN|nr:toll/interleukin-1 receptor domain-containing protein [Catellatospora coxensis]GIG05896.1 hypothetical protein Cco03nite_25960 [Catellatospora coxensis]
MSGPVFISFSREHDAPYARRLAAHLVASGLSILYDTQPVTDSWWSTYTRSQLDSCSAVIVVMTPAAQRDGWVAREVEHARRLGRPVLPLLLEGLPWPTMSEQEDVTGGGLPGATFVQRLQAATGGAPAVVEAPGNWFAVPVRGGVTGTAVGIEVGGGAFLPLIAAGTVVPCASTQLFTTADDGQPVLKVRVYHGDSPTVAGNRSLGVYELQLEPAPAGVPQIGVTLRVEHDGAFRLTAVQADGREVSVRLS